MMSTIDWQAQMTLLDLPLFKAIQMEVSGWQEIEENPQSVSLMHSWRINFSVSVRSSGSAAGVKRES
jgi:hypothetical protein